MNKLLEAFKVSDSSLKDAVDLYNESKVNRETAKIYAQSLSTDTDIYTEDDFLEELYGVIGYYYTRDNGVSKPEPVMENKQNSSKTVDRKPCKEADIKVIAKAYITTIQSFKYIYGKEPLNTSFNMFKKVLEKNFKREFKSMIKDTGIINKIIMTSPDISFGYGGVNTSIIFASDIMYNFELSLVKLGIKDTEILKILEESIMDCRNHKTLGVKHDMMMSMINEALTSSSDIGGVPRGISLIQRYILGVLPFYGTTAVRAFLTVLSGLRVIQEDKELLSDWISSMSEYCKLMNYQAPNLNYGSVGPQLVLTACLLNDISYIFKDDMIASDIANYCSITYKETLSRIQQKLNLTECDVISQVADRQSDIRKLMEIALSSVK